MEKKNNFKFQTDSRPVIQGTEVKVDEKHLNKKQIRLLFVSAICNFCLLLFLLVYSYLKEGNADLRLGAVGLVILAGSFVAAVYGQFDYRLFEKEKKYLGMIGTRLHMLVFLLSLGLYIYGTL